PPPKRRRSSLPRSPPPPPTCLSSRSSSARTATAPISLRQRRLLLLLLLLLRRHPDPDPRGPVSIFNAPNRPRHSTYKQRRPPGGTMASPSEAPLSGGLSRRIGFGRPPGVGGFPGAAASRRGVGGLQANGSGGLPQAPWSGGLSRRVGGGRSPGVGGFPGAAASRRGVGGLQANGSGVDEKAVLGIPIGRFQEDTWAWSAEKHGFRGPILCGMWAIWNARNKRNHGETSMSITQTCRWARDMASDLIQTSGPCAKGSNSIKVTK
ncbi:hypothetical protein BRADI_5g17045v3, partial [Brachypodium distachyon]